MSAVTTVGSGCDHDSTDRVRRKARLVPGLSKAYFDSRHFPNIFFFVASSSSLRNARVTVKMQSTG